MVRGPQTSSLIVPTERGTTGSGGGGGASTPAPSSPASVLSAGMLVASIAPAPPSLPPASLPPPSDPPVRGWAVLVAQAEKIARRTLAGRRAFIIGCTSDLRTGVDGIYPEHDVGRRAGPHVHDACDVAKGGR